jgi:hypothetical protein
MLDEAFEMVANTSNLGPSSPQAASIFMAHVSVLQRVGLFEKLVQVLSCLLDYPLAQIQSHPQQPPFLWPHLFPGRSF